MDLPLLVNAFKLLNANYPKGTYPKKGECNTTSFKYGNMPSKAFCEETAHEGLRLCHIGYTGFEAHYKAQITPWFAVTGDVQVINAHSEQLRHQASVRSSR